ncbi:Eco29kI family restriction endonuclease [Sedimenticola hydrogenitrophicus]|uniref:Eco29kI family restriction endonuclease n=1 Tax=Sedimenticola hydrogenitrophicus TaxID=2967975 RepID=UPI0021A8309F|nr:Eco29kI family restriction endonuclease [Sedimenticola hydrogenitrophicus]
MRERLAHLRELLPSLSKPAAKKTMAELLSIMGDIEAARSDLDPIKDPGTSFDPTDPDTAGHLVALALIAQDRVPLGRLAKTYGSGVYAIYYHGDHPLYGPVSGTETPIYVGKADPENPTARTPREQGPRLYGRLNDHRRMIKTVGEHAQREVLPHPLRVEDFDARRLICATNAQLVAERHLIGMFRPVWNNEIGICWGISKHGDAATTRANKRSPWDVIHPGRAWAMAAALNDKMTPEEIERRVGEHFGQTPPYRDTVHIVREFLAAFVQHAAMSPEEPADNDDADTDAGDEQR